MEDIKDWLRRVINNMDIDERLEESIENKYMQDDKGKNKMKLTVEESFYILKRKDFNSYVEEKAIEALLSELDKDNNIISDLQNEVTLKQCELDKKDKRIKRQFKIIKKRDKQIEELKQIAHNDFEERCRLTFKLEELENELDKKDKIINDMAEELVNGIYDFKSKKQVINHFTNKYEEGKGE